MKADIISKLIGDDTVFSLRHRVFNVIALIGICMSFTACIMNYVLGLGATTVIVTFGCGVISVGLYLMSIIGRQYALPALVTVIILSFIFFPVMWIINAGTYGSIPYYMIINAGIIAVLLGGSKRAIVLALFAGVVGALIAVEYRRPDFITGYDSMLTRYLDTAFGFFVCLLANAVFFAVLVDSYAHERQRAEQYFATLKEQNKEIEAKNRMLEKSNAELKEAKEKADELNCLLYEEKQKLQKLSITDGLTGLFNKRFINTRLNEEIEISQQSRRKLAVALIDIDDFKSINDTYGHLFGDYVLKRISGTIVNNLRQNDVVGRYGGEEFLIMLPDTGREEGYAIVDRIRRKVLELQWEHKLQVTISGGVTELGNNQMTDLLKQADRLLYRAKFKGKNRIEKEPA